VQRDGRKWVTVQQNFKELIDSTEYDFLRRNPRLGPRIMLLGVSGSYGYGTNREGSDVDLRGVALNLASDLIGLTEFEQYEDRGTDTVIYGFNKLIRLLLNCNPNTIEMLGLDEDQYLILSETGRELLEHKELFLSKRAAASFGHYADAQLRRLQNAIARDSLPQAEREQHILRSLHHAMEDFERRHEEINKGAVRLYADQAVADDSDTEIFIDAELRHFPLRSYGDMVNSLNSVVRNYDRIGKRNHKKDDNHLNKHAMHLIRLFLMGIDILEEAQIRTHRPAGDLELLRRIRNGEYMKDGVLVPEFYAIVAEYEKRFEEAERRSCLPDAPDMERVEAFVERINRRVILEDVRA